MTSARLGAVFEDTGKGKWVRAYKVFAPLRGTCMLVLGKSWHMKTLTTCRLRLPVLAAKPLPHLRRTRTREGRVGRIERGKQRYTRKKARTALDVKSGGRFSLGTVRPLSSFRTHSLVRVLALRRAACARRAAHTGGLRVAGKTPRCARSTSGHTS